MAGWEIDWSSAEVKGAKLTVAVKGGEDAKKWSARVQSVLRLLDRSGGKWGEIKISRQKIVVSDLREDAAPDLRHLLESAVLQANSDLAPEDEHDDDHDDDEDDDGQDDEGQSSDQSMTETFRGFGSGSSEESSDKDDQQGKESDTGEGKRDR